MNFLAHLHIAKHCNSNLAGNLLGDFVKGALINIILIPFLTALGFIDLLIAILIVMMYLVLQNRFSQIKHDALHLSHSMYFGITA